MPGIIICSAPVIHYIAKKVGCFIITERQILLDLYRCKKDIDARIH